MRRGAQAAHGDQMMPTENVFQDGPYLTAAFLCERIIEEKDGVKSFVRVVNRIVSSARGPEVPERMPPIPVRLSLYLSMRTGNKSGKHEIRISFLRPDNTAAGPQLVQSVNLEPPESRGIDLAINLNLMLDQEGVYWFDVFFDGLRMTRIPLSVLYLTQTAGKDQAPSAVQ
jgi:hypothetical protein